MHKKASDRYLEPEAASLRLRASKPSDCVPDAICYMPLGSLLCSYRTRREVGGVRIRGET